MYNIGNRIKFKYGNEIYTGKITEINKECYKLKNCKYLWNNEWIGDSEEPCIPFKDAICKVSSK